MSAKPLRIVSMFAVGLLLAGCVSPRIFPPGSPCATPVMAVSDEFAGARRGSCTVLADDHVALAIVPEDAPPINDSPWFAFRLHAAVPRTVTVTLDYQDGHHRYVPKLSHDGRHWQALDAQRISVSPGGQRATFDVALPGKPVFIAAQELILPVDYGTWIKQVSAVDHVTASLMGFSREGRPIVMLEAGVGNANVLLIVGRQHPPEVSGAFAFRAFAETVFGNGDLANRFRQRFRVLAVPLLNPDGVVAGHWRHNLGGVDLNRDWGPFTQPETQTIRDLLDALDAAGDRLRLFLDFHSTKRNVFYTQNDDFVTEPPRFMTEWLERAAERIENYAFENDPRPVSEQANSKNYMYRRYGIPTATYEVGDETDRDAAARAAEVFAEELMSMLLEQDFSQ